MNKVENYFSNVPYQEANKLLYVQPVKKHFKLLKIYLSIKKQKKGKIKKFLRIIYSNCTTIYSCRLPVGI